MATAQFVNIASGDMPLESIRPTGDDVADNVAIQTLDAYGYTLSNYDWNDWAADEPCWVDGDFNPVKGVTFAPGQGLWVFGSTASQGIQTAGKVGISDVLVQLKSGGTATGNPFPTTIALQDIVPMGDDVADNVAIQTLDAYGYTVANYDWNDWAADKPCWVDGDFNPVEGVEFTPGQGLWVFGSSESQYLRFPAPEL